MIKTNNISFKNQEIKLIEVENDTGLKLVLTSFGAGIYNVFLDNKLMTAQNEVLEDYLVSTAYFGKTVGRTCGRIKNGIATINGQEFKVSLPNGSIHQLHGGNGVSFKVWDVDIKEDDNKYQVIFKTSCLDKEDGFPGNLDIEAIYEVSKKENVFKIIHKAKSDQDTLVNLTNHTYWNLNSFGTILNHKLKIDASRYARIDKEMLFIEETDVNDIMDFRKTKTIGKDMFDKSIYDAGSAGYDHDWILDKKNKGHQVELSSDDEKIKLEIETTYPICHIYAATTLDELYIGCAIELEKRAYSHPSITLKKNEPYFEETSFRFVKGE